MKALFILPLAAFLLSSCGQLSSVGYSIRTDYGTYRDNSLNGKADGSIELDFPTEINLRTK